jgi:hypothetical protein
MSVSEVMIVDLFYLAQREVDMFLNSLLLRKVKTKESNISLKNKERYDLTYKGEDFMETTDDGNRVW